MVLSGGCLCTQTSGSMALLIQSQRVPSAVISVVWATHHEGHPEATPTTSCRKVWGDGRSVPAQDGRFQTGFVVPS